MTYHAAVYRCPSHVDVTGHPNLWVERIPFAAATQEAARLRMRELTRSATRPRVVVLRYPDATELVVTGRRGPNGRADLDRIAFAAAGADAPEWTDDAFVVLPGQARGPLTVETCVLPEVDAGDLPAALTLITGTEITATTKLAVGAPVPGLLDYLPCLDPSGPLVHLTRNDAGQLVARCWRRPGQAPDLLDRLRQVFDPAERDLIIARGRGAENPHEPATIHELLGRQAELTPDAVAVADGDTELTYRDLVDRASRLASGLGTGRGDRVGVCLDRSADLVVALLAVLMTGAAYVPLDPAHPAGRRAFIAQDAGLKFVITDIDREPGDAAGQEASPDDPAYVIYTSGSTGRPKGVVVSHRNVLRLLAATRDEFAFSGRTSGRCSTPARSTSRCGRSGAA